MKVVTDQCVTDVLHAVRNCPLHVSATCPLTLLRRALAERGEVTLKLADLDGLLGMTDFKDGSTVYLDHNQSEGEWRATLAHELLHLLRGPVPNVEAHVEEVRVRHEAARLLIPMGAALGAIDRKWDPDVLQELAARTGSDIGTARDAVDPPTMPLPAVPSPRQADGDAA